MKPFIAKIHYYPEGSTGKSSAEGHVKYMVRPDKEEVFREEGKSALFGDDIERDPELEETIEELKKIQAEAPTWRAILSLTSQDVEELGNFEKREGWENALRLSMPKIMKDLELKEGRWVAAMHAKDGQPHVHLIFWDGAGKSGRQEELLSKREFTLIKKAWVDEIYKDYFSQIGKNKADLRAQVLKMVERGEPKDREKLGFEFIMSKTLKRELASRLEALGQSLPKNGRIAFGFMPPEIKTQVLEITDWLLRQPQFVDLVAEYKDQAAKFAQPKSSNPSDWNDARQKAYEDLQKRVANQLLRGAKDINKGFDNKDSFRNKSNGSQEYWRQEQAGQVAKEVDRGIRTLLQEQRETMAHKLRPVRNEDWTLEKL